MLSALEICAKIHKCLVLWWLFPFFLVWSETLFLWLVSDPTGMVLVPITQLLSPFLMGKSHPSSQTFPHMSFKSWKPHSGGGQRAWTASYRQGSFVLPEHPDQGGCDWGGEDSPTTASTTRKQRGPGGVKLEGNASGWGSWGRSDLDRCPGLKPDPRQTF